MEIAVLIPCHNEGLTIGRVVKDFHAHLPTARVYVYDNNSTDDTAAAASAVGAVVCTERIQGKGNVVRRMFADVDADVYVLVDGDATYSAASAPKLIQALVDEKLDMVVGARLKSAGSGAFRSSHVFGNRVLTKLVSLLFDYPIQDMLSGYRVFSRRFVKSCPTLASGFEIETELTVHCLAIGLRLLEIDTPYIARPAGSVSKLNTYRDGARILVTALRLLKAERPAFLFMSISIALAALGLILGIPIVGTYLETGLVPRLPTALLAASLMILAFLSLTSGIILASVAQGRRELKRLFYLQCPARAS